MEAVDDFSAVAYTATLYRVFRILIRERKTYLEHSIRRLQEPEVTDVL